MTESLGTAAAAFVGTNLDDIFMLMLFFARCTVRRQKMHVVLGQYLGIGTLVLVSLLASAGLRVVPQEYLRLLGLLPIFLGIRAWMQRGGDGADVSGGNAWNVALVTIANGGDNLGVYIPLFTGFSAVQTVVCVTVFAGMTALWCFLGAKLAELPGLRRFLENYRSAIVPLVLTALGVYILLGG